jgi:hypothetical protein
VLLLMVEWFTKRISAQGFSRLTYRHVSFLSLNNTPTACAVALAQLRRAEAQTTKLTQA